MMRTRLPILALCFALLAGVAGFTPRSATPQGAVRADNDSLLLGNPTEARHDESTPLNYLVEHRQYALSYNQARGGPNWVSWHVQDTDLGKEPRTNRFTVDPELPVLLRMKGSAYAGSGYDRGHMCPSGDRTSSPEDNAATFYMSNMLPQKADLNRGVWKNLEVYCRTLVAGGDELYITAGGGPSREMLSGGRIEVPESCWKVIVDLPKGDGDLARIDEATRVIAVSMPNKDGVKALPWQQTVTTPAAIEAANQLHFFGNVSESLRAVLDAKRDVAPPLPAPPGS